MPKCWAPIHPPRSRRLCPPLPPLPQLPQRPKSKPWTPSQPTSAYLHRPSHRLNPPQLQRRPRRPLPPWLNLLRPSPLRDPNLVPQYLGRSPRRPSSPPLRRRWADNRSLRPRPPLSPLRPSSQRQSPSEHRFLSRLRLRSHRSRRNRLRPRTQSLRRRRRRLQERHRGCRTLPPC